MYKEHITTLPIYDIKVCLILSEDSDLVLEKHSLDVSEAEALVIIWGLNTKEGEHQSVFMYFYAEPTINTIAHESVHAATCVYEIIETEIGEGKNEPFAYLVGWFAEEVDRFIKS